MWGSERDSEGKKVEARPRRELLKERAISCNQINCDFRHVEKEKPVGASAPVSLTGHPHWSDCPQHPPTAPSRLPPRVFQ